MAQCPKRLHFIAVCSIAFIAGIVDQKILYGAQRRK